MLRGKAELRFYAVRGGEKRLLVIVDTAVADAAVADEEKVR